jgi:hypothetical protein
VKILGHEYKVEYTPNLTDRADAAGICDTEKLEMSIDANIPDTRQQEAVLHEVIEAINYHAELKLRHQAITLLSECLYQVFKDNGGVPVCLCREINKINEGDD